MNQLSPVFSPLGRDYEMLPLTRRLLQDCNLAFPDAHTYWIAHTFGTLRLDPQATEVEINIWMKAALFALQEFGVNHRTMQSISDMAQHIACTSAPA